MMPSGSIKVLLRGSHCLEVHDQAYNAAFEQPSCSERAYTGIGTSGWASVMLKIVTMSELLVPTIA